MFCNYKSTHVKVSCFFYYPYLLEIELIEIELKYIRFAVEVKKNKKSKASVQA